MSYRSVSIDGPPGAPVDEVYQVLSNHLLNSRGWSSLATHTEDIGGGRLQKAGVIFSRLSAAPKDRMVFKRHAPHIMSLIGALPQAVVKSVEDETIGALNEADLHIVIVPTLDYCVEKLKLDSTVIAQRQVLVSEYANIVYGTIKVEEAVQGRVAAISQSLALNMSHLTIAREIIRLLRGQISLSRYSMKSLLDDLGPVAGGSK